MFSKFLGDRPERLGIVASLYDQYTASYLTSQLMNIYARDKKNRDQYQSINSFMVEWDVNVNFIKRVPFLIAPIGNGANGTEIICHFPENYYQKYDVFTIERSRQQLMVLSRPVRRSDRDFEVVCKLVDSDYSAELDLTACAPGMTTRFLTNYHPEFHSEGYVKYQSNVERHRTYISLHRCDVSYSEKYEAMEDQFITIAKDGDKAGVTYKMNSMDKDLLDTFMLASNNANMFGKTNVDKNGRPTIFDPEDGQPIITGDGIIPQIERFAGKHIFTKFTLSTLKLALKEMRDRAEKPQGNTWMFVMNSAMYDDAQDVLDNWIAKRSTDGAFLYSKETNGMVKLGATYVGYEWGGNSIIIHVDKSLDVEFPERKVALCMDLTPDGQRGDAAIKMFTFKGKQYVQSVLHGPGTGSHVVSTPVAGGKKIAHGYSGVAVFCPYKSFILMSA